MSPEQARGPADRPPHRPVQPRRRALPDGDRAAAVHRLQHVRRDGRGRFARAAAGPALAPDVPPALVRSDRPVDGEEPDRSPAERGGRRRGTRSDRTRRGATAVPVAPGSVPDESDPWVGIDTVNHDAVTVVQAGLPGEAREPAPNPKWLKPAVAGGVVLALALAAVAAVTVWPKSELPREPNKGAERPPEQPARPGPTPGAQRQRQAVGDPGPSGRGSADGTRGPHRPGRGGDRDRRQEGRPVADRAVRRDGNRTGGRRLPARLRGPRSAPAPGALNGS